MVLSEAVPLEPGSGLIQLSPRFNEQARQIAQAHGLPVLETLASDGVFVSEIRPWRGLGLHQAVPLIVQDLQQRGLVFGVEAHERMQPACPDCASPLIDIASRGWYLRTAAARHRLASLACKVEWRPALPSFEPGAVGLAPATDWLVSRGRSWAAPLPIWDCRGCQQSHVVGSLAELAALAGANLADLDLHRPALDTLELACPDCGEPMQRQVGVLEPWFELGCLALRSYNSLGEQTEHVGEATDLVCGVLGQPSEWLTALHLVSGLLRDEPAYRQALWLPLAHLAEPAGSHEEPLTPLVLLREQGADALRWTLYLQPPGDPLLVSPEVISQAGESFLSAAWGLGELLNSRVDLHLLRLASPSTQSSSLDDWLRSRLHSLVRDVTTALEAAETRSAAQALQAFIQSDLVGWYVPLRLTRRHAGLPVLDCYRPLFEALVTLSRLLAPLVPFLAEWLYQSLVRGMGQEGRESVHLEDWPVFDPDCILPELDADIAAVRRLAGLGRAARQAAALPLHQPLVEAAFSLADAEANRLLQSYGDLLVEDLNVRAVRLLAPAEETELLADERHLWTVASEDGALAALTVRLTPELVSEGLAGEFILRVGELRQKAGLAPQERIRIVYTASARLAEALETHRALICMETQADALQSFTRADPPRSSEALKSLFTITQFHGEKVTFGIEKA